MPDKKYRIETQCIQAGYKAESGQPQVPPIVQNTTYRYYNAADVAKLFDLESADFMYTRLGSPICGAASPTPSARSIVSNMSAISSFKRG